MRLYVPLHLLAGNWPKLRLQRSGYYRRGKIHSRKTNRIRLRCGSVRPDDWNVSFTKAKRRVLPSANFTAASGAKDSYMGESWTPGTCRQT